MLIPGSVVERPAVGHGAAGEHSEADVQEFSRRDGGDESSRRRPSFDAGRVQEQGALPMYKTNTSCKYFTIIIII